MVDHQRAGGRRHLGDFTQRHRLPGIRAQIDGGQRLRTAAELRRDFQQHVILVQIGEHLRCHALAERVIERVIDVREAMPRRAAASRSTCTDRISPLLSWSLVTPVSPGILLSRRPRAAPSRSAAAG